MSRRKRIVKREILPDPKYGSLQVASFINGILRRGKRSVAEQIFYDALTQIAKETKTDDPVEVFNKAMKNVSPVVEVKSRRVGGATYQVPVEVNPGRRTALAIRWIITYAKSRGEKTFSQKLARELIAAAKNEGNAIKKRDDTHKMAEANKAFAHFRW
jgi:small subunit ribosomal protein S7